MEDVDGVYSSSSSSLMTITFLRSITDVFLAFLSGFLRLRFLGGGDDRGDGGGGGVRLKSRISRRRPRSGEDAGARVTMAGAGAGVTVG